MEAPREECRSGHQERDHRVIGNNPLRNSARHRAGYGTPRFCLAGTVRKADLVKARQIYCWVARRFTQSSLPLIARSIKRDHSTVLYAIERVDQVICDLNLISDAPRTAEQWIEALWAADWSGQSQRRGRP